MKVKEILDNSEIFRDPDVPYSVKHYTLIGTKFIYSRTLEYWYERITPQHTVYYKDFNEVFDKIINDVTVEDQVKIRIIFNLKELASL